MSFSVSPPFVSFSDSSDVSLLVVTNNCDYPLVMRAKLSSSCSRLYTVTPNFRVIRRHSSVTLKVSVRDAAASDEPTELSPHLVKIRTMPAPDDITDPIRFWNARVGNTKGSGIVSKSFPIKYEYIPSPVSNEPVVLSPKHSLQLRDLKPEILSIFNSNDRPVVVKIKVNNQPAYRIRPSSFQLQPYQKKEVQVTPHRDTSLASPKDRLLILSASLNNADQLDIANRPRGIDLLLRHNQDLVIHSQLVRLTRPRLQNPGLVITITPPRSKILGTGDTGTHISWRASLPDVPSSAASYRFQLLTSSSIRSSLALSTYRLSKGSIMTSELLPSDAFQPYEESIIEYYEEDLLP